jgi:hypothetical protein
MEGDVRQVKNRSARYAIREAATKSCQQLAKESECGKEIDQCRKESSEERGHR